MQEKRFVKIFRTTKIIQLLILLALEIAFFTILIKDPLLRREIYENSTLLFLSSIIWVLMIFFLLCLFSDFFRLRCFAEESHALNKAAYLDDLTGIPNRHGLDVVFQTYDTSQTLSQVGCFMVTIDNLKSINEKHGHKSGDTILQQFSSIFEEIGDQFGVVGRNGGNDFLMVMNNCTHTSMTEFIDKLNKRVTEYNTQFSHTPIHISYAYVLNNELKADDFPMLLTATYQKLHK